jgi:hypothetical protein
MCEGKTLLKTLGIFMVVCLFPGCGGEPVPPEYIGTWTSSSPGYQRASMEITSETITFRDGKGYAGVNRIIDFEKKEDKDGAVYKIVYEGNEGGPSVLSFCLTQVRIEKNLQTVIVYKNQKNLTWTKEAG